jgi:hypothetical protein
VELSAQAIHAVRLTAGDRYLVAAYGSKEKPQHQKGLIVLRINDARGRTGVDGLHFELVNHALLVWNLQREQLLATFSSDYRLESCDFSPDERIAVVGTASGLVHFLELEGFESTFTR